MSGGPGGCDGPGKYQYDTDGKQVKFNLVSDECKIRQIILDGSTWLPAGTVVTKPPAEITITSKAQPPSRAKRPDKGSWPSFRGPHASGIAEGQNLPDEWNGKTGENILWRTPIPGLAHSSPVVWGNRIFVTSAVSSDPKASFRPGLYGDGDASKDRSLTPLDDLRARQTDGKIVWERVATRATTREAPYQGDLCELDARNRRSHRRRVVRIAGRLCLRRQRTFLWKVDLGRIDAGAYDVPTVEWGPASSPIIWKDLVILQCDTQPIHSSWRSTPTPGRQSGKLIATRFLRGARRQSQRPRKARSWSPTRRTSFAVTIRARARNCGDSDAVRRSRRRRRSLRTTLLVVVSGRGPERPIFVVKAGARGDLTLPEGKTSSDTVIWSRTGRGSYMPTPLIYNGILYVLANNGTFDAYNLKTGEEIYRQRLPVVGSGFSASPVASDGKIYLSNEDGEILVVSAGEKFNHIATNSMGELLMATPALSDGVMYVRSSASLFAIGKKKKKHSVASVKSVSNRNALSLYLYLQIRHPRT